ncbi:hypothetical protein CG716_13115 [Mycolicibacterium sphagni]|uniref:HTH tetR-type domain-containing protein n=2 Tax=Mycolicibacterium sphagni TaxID=1786 RepID=A0A255DIQ5_9MYCO|nr:hypothetical protein CG716_13115 [Mycolicibacterium sphagni]
MPKPTTPARSERLRSASPCACFDIRISCFQAFANSVNSDSALGSLILSTALIKSFASATLMCMTPSASTQPAAPKRGPGRPRSSATPDAIRRAARTLFAERGFSHTSVRDIASLAGSDPAVVIRHFGSKEKLFLEVVAVDPQFRGLVEGPLATLGRQILEKVVEADGSILRLYAALLGALDRPEVRRYLEQATAQHIIAPLAARLHGPDARLRAQLVAAQIGGLLMSVALADAPSSELVGATALDYYAAGIQSLIEAPAPRQSRDD